MIEAWKKFFGTGWLYGKEPSKQDCFKAGYEAAIEMMKNMERVIINPNIELTELTNRPGAIIKYKSKRDF